MKVSHVFQTFLPLTSGGVENYLLTITKYLSLNGAESQLFVPHYSGLTRVTDLSYLKVYRTGSISPSRSLISKRYFGPLFWFLFLKYVYPYDSLRYIIKNKLSENTEVFHVHSGTTPSILRMGHDLSLRTNSPYIVTIHQRFGNKKSDLDPRYNLYEKYLGKAAYIIAPRRSTLNKLNNWGLNDKTVFLPICIDLSKYQQQKETYQRNDGRLRILSVGGLTPRRDPITLLKAFFKIFKDYKNVDLHFVGSGDVHEIRKLIAKYQASDRVFLHGLQFDVTKYFAASDIFLSLNIADNYPSLALREAMAASLACIVTDVGDTKELVTSGFNGLLVTPCSVDSVSSAIISLIEDENLRKKLSSNAKKSSASFDASKRIKDLIKIYQDAIRNKK